MNPTFHRFRLDGAGAGTFLQGQVTLDVRKLGQQLAYTAICDLKGRVQFGLWLARIADNPAASSTPPALPAFGKAAKPVDPALIGSFVLIAATDQADALEAHIRKYAAFASATLTRLDQAQGISEAGQCSFDIHDLLPAEAEEPAPLVALSGEDWAELAVSQGVAWITAATAGQFQPQELRLHQRDGVDYDKGCYLGQEIVARLYFRGRPKQWLHRIAGSGQLPAPGQAMADGVSVVNVAGTAESWQALVIARPAALAESGLSELPLPAAMQAVPWREQDT